MLNIHNTLQNLNQDRHERPLWNHFASTMLQPSSYSLLLIYINAYLHCNYQPNLTIVPPQSFLLNRSTRCITSSDWERSNFLFLHNISKITILKLLTPNFSIIFEFNHYGNHIVKGPSHSYHNMLWSRSISIHNPKS